jgi:DNA mismatch repair protein MutS
VRLRSPSPLDKIPADLTPFMRQWTAAKRENPDALLFFRMGDFYELFYDDAVTVSRELQLTLTARDRERNQPMCGVPYHAVESYLMRLLRKGYRVALCDQMEDPKLTKKIVRREVTRVLSPGTALDAGLGQEQNNFLAAYFESKGGHKAKAQAEMVCAVALLDVSTGEFRTAEFQGATARQQAVDEIVKAGRARCWWPRARSCRRSWSGFRRGRASRTGFGRGSLRCRWWSGS